MRLDWCYGYDTGPNYLSWILRVESETEGNRRRYFSLFFCGMSNRNLDGHSKRTKS